MTGQWEAFLKKIQHGESRLEPFLDGISQYVRTVVSKVGLTSPVRRVSVPETSMKSDSPDLTSLAKIPTFTTLTELLQNAFGFSKFRPNQEAVCEAVTAGHDRRRSCRQARASRFVTNCRDWHGVERLL